MNDVNDLGVQCHECGERFASVSQHCRRTHSISTHDYLQRHGIDPINAPKRTDGRVRRRAHPCRRCTVPITTNAKLCDNCKADYQRERDGLQPRPTPRSVWRDLTDTERTHLTEADDDHLAELIPALQADRVPSVRIAKALGHSTAWMTKYWPSPTFTRGKPHWRA
ncbi:hypothetical protein FOJ82_00450 [Tessaracoccus rhinocerotis]|uniref:Uncharacterized protein n=1 Tax=Tessaracoccus rhinocerotis TaxID=1689449 RepID=A0A553K3Y9_9ACTN|nr:hypothetical protein [Tessaracoccus rhinocerotis]TRY19422.1 hypothetical protein FOJ82_00450 [Tessaracoccus rhinocerotis]